MTTTLKKIGFLSFGAWHPGGGMTNTGGDALRQTVELAVAAEEIGIDGAFVRVHHFARQLSSPFPLLTAIGVRTSRIEIGTGVIDMGYENPLYMAEEAAAADLLAGGRLQRGVSQPRLPRTGLARCRGARLLGRPRGGAREDSVVPRRDQRRRRSPSRYRRPPGQRDACRTTTVARPRRADLVGLRLTRDGRLGRRTGDEPDELDAAPRRHAGPVRPAPGRADRALPRGVARSRAHARAARLGEPQRDTDHVRPRPAALRRRQKRGPSRLARRRHQPVRPQLHGRA
jgi:Luciferase-like monooxygenase